MKIKVPKTPMSAFNKNRRASTLLQMQVAHLEEIARSRSDVPRRYGRASKVRTEGQVAAYVAALTRALHPEGAYRTTPAAAPPPPPVAALAPKPAAAKRTAAKKKTGRKRTATKRKPRRSRRPRRGGR